jgi:hypothetical protein
VSALFFNIILTKFGVYQQVFLKITNLKFHENIVIGSHCDAEGQADMMKLMGAFRYLRPRC